MRASFNYGDLRYQLDGAVDREGGRIEPFTHRLSSRQGVVFEALAISGATSSRVEARFGRALKGAHTAVLAIEPLAAGALVSGAADGAELLPVRAPGCGCRAAAGSRPLLAWDAAGVPRRIALAVPPAVAREADGLAQVMQLTLARVAGGVGLGDVIDVIDWLSCYVRCAIELLACWGRQPDIPGTKDIFDTACWVLWSGCLGLCRFRRPF